MSDFVSSNRSAIEGLRVVLADDSEYLLEMWVRWLDRFCPVGLVGTATSMGMVEGLVAQYEVDLLIVDGSLFYDHTEALAASRRRRPKMRVAVVSGVIDGAEVLGSGADFCASKLEGPKVLFSIVEQVLR